MKANFINSWNEAPFKRMTGLFSFDQLSDSDLYFGITSQVWLNLQKTWELRCAEIDVGREIYKRVMPRKTVA